VKCKEGYDKFFPVNNYRRIIITILDESISISLIHGQNLMILFQRWMINHTLKIFHATN